MEKLTYTVEEAADLLGVGRTRMYELARKGEVPSIRLGRRILVPAHLLREFVGAPPETGKSSEPEPAPKEPEEVHYLVTVRRVSGPREVNL